MFNGAEVNLFRGFADFYLSVLWFPPAVSVEVDRITTHVNISSDPFLAEIMGIQPGISCEIQHVDILPYFVLTLVLNQCRLNQWDTVLLFCLFFLVFVYFESLKCSGNNRF